MARTVPRRLGTRCLYVFRGASGRSSRKKHCFNNFQYFLTFFNTFSTYFQHVFNIVFNMLATCFNMFSTCFQHADLKLYPVDFPDFSGNLPMGSLRKSPKIGKSSGSNLHSSISWIFAQNAEWSLDPADFSIFPEICRWGAHENQKNTENRPGPTSTVGSRGAPRDDPKGP